MGVEINILMRTYRNNGAKVFRFCRSRTFDLHMHCLLHIAYGQRPICFQLISLERLHHTPILALVRFRLRCTITAKTYSHKATMRINTQVGLTPRNRAGGALKGLKFYISHDSQPLQFFPCKIPMTFICFIVPMARMVLGFGILAFPFLLPLAISALFFHNDGDEGTSNEDMWAKERERRTRMRYCLCNGPTYSFILLLDYMSSESLPSAPAARIWLSGVIDQCMENPNGLQTVTFVAHEVSYNIGN